ncbi:hypothetical protein BS47DRAFT_1364946 [Hydnum rufescens UP504]|uniref:Uncharacterized protein n=1 Tax=Hydnum rufescens UP504 TaxID=1448309 RepID=A0A9P6DST8_9AGAM|nr:hypothetical protein BS47DRAFT_1364946 [Hydnum rufescens UP504]
MPIQQLSLAYHHFNHIDDDPFIGIHSSTPICYSPTPENSFEGIILSKSIKWMRYIVWVQDHYAPYQQKDLKVVLIPPQVFPTSVLNLEVIDTVQGITVDGRMDLVVSRVEKTTRLLASKAPAERHQKSTRQHTGRVEKGLCILAYPPTPTPPMPQMTT